MPELPEVECLTRSVAALLNGGRVESADFLRSDLRDPIPVKLFKACIEGAPVVRVYRRSKYMLIETASGTGIFHLGMTGNLIVAKGRHPEAPHTHAVFGIRTKSGRHAWLHYVDPRRFGRIDCVRETDLMRHPWFSELGPEPLVLRELGRHLFNVSRMRHAPVKPFLMDARVVVGVGNIYASEALFRAGVRPDREAGAISLGEFKAIASAVKAVLRASIAAGGTTFRDYRHTDGTRGYYKVSLNVYERSGEPCQKCGNPVRQIRQSGRSTYFCPFCQK